MGKNMAAATKSPVKVRQIADVEYQLTYKKVKRLNLRVRADGTVAVSAPRGTGVKQVDAFVGEHAGWIREAQARVLAVPVQEDRYRDEDCLEAFQPVLDRLYPLVAYAVPDKPPVKVRFMKSRWGVCNLRSRTITLNKQLMDKPMEAVEYVVLHELVHLIHPNHQAGFHQEMKRLMPDYLKRKALLSVSREAQDPTQMDKTAVG